MLQSSTTDLNVIASIRVSCTNREGCGWSGEWTEALSEFEAYRVLRETAGARGDDPDLIPRPTPGAVAGLFCPRCLWQVDLEQQPRAALRFGRYERDLGGGLHLVSTGAPLTPPRPPGCPHASPEWCEACLAEYIALGDAVRTAKEIPFCPRCGRAIGWDGRHRCEN